MVSDQAVRHPEKRSARIPFAVSPEKATSVSARFEAEGRKMYGGMGEAWTYLSTIIAGVVVWGGAGYGLDHLLGTKPVLFVVGALLGNFAGIYLVYLKAFRDESAGNASKKEVKRDAA
jgi:ATP synthase protein I